MQKQQQQQQPNIKKTSNVQVQSTFQFSDLAFEEPKEQNVVVQPALPKTKPTGPWSDDLIEDKDDPSWTVVQRKRRRKRAD
jgi:hypothetical protein